MKRLTMLALAAGLAAPASAQISNLATWKGAYDKCAANQSPTSRLATCEAALEAIPANDRDAAWPHYFMSDAKLSLNDFDGAIAEADIAEKLQPNERHILNMGCWARAVANRDLAAARKKCDAANQENPDDPGQWDSTGFVALRQGRWMDAWKAYEKALNLDRGMASARYGSGLATIAMGDSTSGQVSLKQALARDATIADVFKGYGVTPETIKAAASRRP